MKKKILNMLLCLSLVISLSAAAAAAALNTDNLTISGGTLVIGEAEDEILVSLHQSGKTAKIAIPYGYNDGAYYVVKDDCVIVTTSPEKKDGMMRFPVIGAGKYVISEGTPPTLDEQLNGGSGNVVLGTDKLNSSYDVANGTVIHANGTAIKGATGKECLTAEGNLTIKDFGSNTDIILDTGDKVSFTAEGKAVIVPAENKNSDGNPVGYGSFRITAVNKDGKEITRTYFVVMGSSVSVLPDGTVSHNGVFEPGAADAVIPPYRVTYKAHDNSHVKGTSGKVVSSCNGLYDHFIRITITLQGSDAATVLASKIEGKDVIAASGVSVSEGSTVLTLESSYLNTLPAGEHTLAYHYDDGGKVVGTLKIQNASAQADPTNPKTGDPIMGILATLLGSAAGLAVLSSAKRKVW